MVITIRKTFLSIFYRNKKWPFVVCVCERLGERLLTILLCFRYKRKGSSSLGLQPGRQLVTWEESNKKSKGAHKKGADRYFSTVSRQLLSSQPPVPALPAIPESSDVTSPTVYLPLGDDEKNKETEPGRQRYC